MTHFLLAFFSKVCLLNSIENERIHHHVKSAPYNFKRENVL